MGLSPTRSLCAGQCNQTLQDPQVLNAQDHQAETAQCPVSLRHSSANITISIFFAYIPAQNSTDNCETVPCTLTVLYFQNLDN